MIARNVEVEYLLRYGIREAHRSHLGELRFLRDRPCMLCRICAVALASSDSDSESIHLAQGQHLVFVSFLHESLQGKESLL